MGPCHGVRVIDLARTLPGRFCTLMLADLGAEVITVEPPRVPSSKIKPIGRDTGARYLAINRNKKSICLDLSKEEGRTAFYDLIRKTDVGMSAPGCASATYLTAAAIGRITIIDFNDLELSKRPEGQSSTNLPMDIYRSKNKKTKSSHLTFWDKMDKIPRRAMIYCPKTDAGDEFDPG